MRYFEIFCTYVMLTIEEIHLMETQMQKTRFLKVAFFQKVNNKFKFQAQDSFLEYFYFGDWEI